MACPRGHRLECKTVKAGGISKAAGEYTDAKAGGVLRRLSKAVSDGSAGYFDPGFGNKSCCSCGKKLEQGMVRYSCKACDFHLCRKCSGFSEDGRPICKYGAACYNHDPEHRRIYAHDSAAHGVEEKHLWRACKFGFECTRRDSGHLTMFAHPGDRHYRMGLVVFGTGQGPEFQTLRQLFSYFDMNESGWYDSKEFANAAAYCQRWSGKAVSLKDAWEAAGGQTTGRVNFPQFATWAGSFGVGLPVGLDTAGARRPCRFRMLSKEGCACSCPHFRPVAENSFLCECGHKTSMHRSDLAERSSAALLSSEAMLSLHWEEGKTGMVKVFDRNLMEALFNLLVGTHKNSDNWTRDRGCRLHGVNGCPAECAMRNRAPVPKGYTLHRAFRNQNPELWAKYSLCRSTIAEECERECRHAKFSPVPVASNVALDAPTEFKRCNEWRLLHGTSLKNCRGICESNFNVAMSGAGATWKEEGKDKGMPLYGYGLYMAERITKADEYSEEVPAGEHYAGYFTAIVCRVVGGRCNVVTTNAIDANKLQADVFDGPYHSVLGDRVTELKKPYREIVVYDTHQVFPEFVLFYSREW